LAPALAGQPEPEQQSIPQHCVDTVHGSFTRTAIWKLNDLLLFS